MSHVAVVCSIVCSTTITSNVSLPQYVQVHHLEYNGVMSKPFTYAPDNVSYFNRKRNLKPKTPKKCPECGKVFLPEYWSEVCCSDTCKNNRYSRRVAHPSKSTGSFLNMNSFEKAWEEAKKEWVYREDNVKVHSWKKTL